MNLPELTKQEEDKRKFYEFAQKRINVRLKKIANENNKFESEVKKDDYTGQVRPGSDR